MTATSQVQVIPRDWARREKLRAKGQFWTPDWIADAMVAYAAKDSCTLFDPAAGEGVFYRALIRFCMKRGGPFHFYGTDVDEQLLLKIKGQDSCESETCQLELRDFIRSPPKRTFPAIVANPPYLRHHRLPRELKDYLSYLSRRVIGSKLDGRAGLHVYFLIQALSLLEKGGRLAFIMPADTVEGVFSQTLWRWITGDFCLECVVTFAPEASPFPSVDTNAMIFLIRRVAPEMKLKWVRCLRSGSDSIRRFIESGFRDSGFPDLELRERSLGEALRTGLSRAPQDGGTPTYRLSDFAYVMRGIATGCNDFFYLTEEKAAELGIPADFLRTAIGRTRDVIGDVITKDTVAALTERGRPTLLFKPNGQKIEELPATVQKYLRRGEEAGLPTRALISTRRPWYKMEERKAPPFLFAYLGRRNARFILNRAGVVPLTGFLCVYPKSDDPDYVGKLWSVLRHPETTKNLHLVGKSYGSGAIKVEPRGLEKLPIPDHVVADAGLAPRTRSFGEPLKLDLGLLTVADAPRKGPGGRGLSEPAHSRRSARDRLKRRTGRAGIGSRKSGLRNEK
jgi:hypothetical protein